MDAWLREALQRTLLSTCAVQFQPCRFAEASTTGSGEDMTIRRVGLIKGQISQQGGVASIRFDCAPIETAQ